MVGVPGDDHDNNSEPQAGVAFVYTRNPSGVWTQVAELRPSDPEDDAKFGNSVALQDNTIVVSAPKKGGTGNSGHGAVYVFTKDANVDWQNDENEDHREETAKLEVDTNERTNTDEFGGEAVAVNDDEDTIVVGAHNRNAAYIFTRPATGWVSTTTAAKLSGSGSFGRSVAVDADAGTIVVGASGRDGNKGSAFVFIEPNNGWANSSSDDATELTAYDRSGGESFGKSVAIDGGTIVVGASGRDGNKGSAFVFIEPDTGWANSPGTEAAKLTASDGSRATTASDNR